MKAVPITNSKGPRKRRNVVAETSFPKTSPFARTGNIDCGNIFCVRARKNASKLFQKHFVSARKVSFARKRGNIVAETFYAMFSHQCFSLSRGPKE